MKRLAAIALLLAFAAPLRADRIAVAVTVTNQPTHGLTFTLNGSTRTWTTNAPSSTQMRISATNSVSATNFYASLAANPFSGRVTISQTASNVVTLYGADGQAMVVSFPSDSWGYYTATTNATSPGFVTRADYATTANTASNATAALALALTNGFVKATITNGFVTASITNGIGGGVSASITNGLAQDVYRIYLRSSAAFAASSNRFVFGPYNINIAAAPDVMPIPAKYRYLKAGVIIMHGSPNLGETNFPAPVMRFTKPDKFDSTDNGSSGFNETEHSTANTFAGSFVSWTNMPNVWTTTNFTSQGSRSGMIWKMTNSVALPAAWWTNAVGSHSGSFWFQSLSLLNGASISVSNGVPLDAYLEFSTTP